MQLCNKVSNVFAGEADFDFGGHACSQRAWCTGRLQRVLRLVYGKACPLHRYVCQPCYLVHHLQQKKPSSADACLDATTGFFSRLRLAELEAVGLHAVLIPVVKLLQLLNDARPLPS